MKRIYAAERQTIGLLLGAEDQVRVWCNGTVRHAASEEARAAVRDDEAVEITLEAGWNDLLIKVTNHTGAHVCSRAFTESRELAKVFNRNQQWEQALAW